MKELTICCEYFYNSFLIPIYIYENNKLNQCYPVQSDDTLPPSHYITELIGIGKKTAYTMTSFYSYYGYLKIENSNSYLVLGPVNNFLHTEESLTAMSREFCTVPSSMKTFYEFFKNIPSKDLDTLINIILFMNYSINHTELTKKDVTDSSGIICDTSIYQTNSKKPNTIKEENINNNYSIENELIHYIENGNVNGLKRLFNQAQNANVGIIAPNDLRQFKNMFIVLVTLSSRAALKGGLSPSIAYPLANTYLQQVERLTDIESIKSYMNQAQLDYTKRVADSIIPSTQVETLFQVIQLYIKIQIEI